MNQATKRFFAKLYLQQASSGDYVDWASDCLEDGFDSKSLRMLAGLNKNHNIKSDFGELFRQSLDELGWNYLGEKEVLLDHSKDLARKILSGELETEKGSHLINQIYVQLGFPAELENWAYLYDGDSTEWYERSRWLPFIQKYNHEKWLEAIIRETKKLVETDFS